MSIIFDRSDHDSLRSRGNLGEPTGHQTAVLRLAGLVAAIKDETGQKCFMACLQKIEGHPDEATLAGGDDQR